MRAATYLNLEELPSQHWMRSLQVFKFPRVGKPRFRIGLSPMVSCVLIPSFMVQQGQAKLFFLESSSFPSQRNGLSFECTCCTPLKEMFRQVQPFFEAV